MARLLINALTKFLLGFGLIAGLLFLPAGTWHYPGGWLFCGLLLLPMLMLGTALFFKAPKLLRKRLDTRETEAPQKKVVGLSALMFAGGFILAGLDFRFGWSDVPKWVTVIASILLLLSYGLYAEVMRENAWLSRTVKVHDGQQIIDTGLYAIVRHPMYMATTVLFLSIPLVLGSWPAFGVFLIYPFLMVSRIRNEEAVLEKGLDGYGAYKRKVRYRLIPFIW